MRKKEIILTIILLILDQISKFGMEKTLLNGSITVIPNFFEFAFVRNTGGAWSLFSNHTVILIIVSIICLFALSLMKKSVTESKLKFISFSFLYAGIIGNLLDRIVFGYVKDFLSFRIFDYDFPVFNIADVLIVIGAFMLILTIGKGDHYEKNNS